MAYKLFETSSQVMKFKSVHIQVDNLTALSYVWKARGTKSQQLLTLLGQICECLFKHQIMIIAEYLREIMNYQADQESWNQKDSSEQKLCPLIFSQGNQRQICLLLGCQMSPQHITREEARSKQFGSRCTTTKVVPQAFLCVPLFALIQRVIRKVKSSCSFFHTDKTNLAESDMVLRVTWVVIERVNTLAFQTNSPSKPPRIT